MMFLRDANRLVDQAAAQTIVIVHILRAAPLCKNSRNADFDRREAINVDFRVSLVSLRPSTAGRVNEVCIYICIVARIYLTMLARELSR